MCGIYLSTKNFSSGKESIRNSIGWRGKDSFGYLEYEDFILAHSRLSIVDLSSNGNQPFKGEKGVLIFNGEIYNYRELRQRYLSEQAFVSDSDTEVLLKLIESGLINWSELRGMYAFAYVEGSSIIFGRDRFGKKPLFYATSEDQIKLSSSISAFESAKISCHSLREFASVGYSYGRDYLYEGVNNCKSGMVFKWSKQGIEKVYDHWEGFCFGNDTWNDQTFHNLFNNSIKRRLVADVPIGLALSSGVDSTVIAANVATLEENIDCFTIPGMREENFAATTASLLGLSHTIVSPVSSSIEDFHNCFHEPFGDSAVVNVWTLAKVARENGFKVVLTGDGADELFLGYSHFRLFRLLDVLWFSVSPLRHLITYISLRLLSKIYLREMGHESVLKDLIKSSNFEKLNPVKLASYVGLRLWVDNCSNRKLDIGSMLGQAEFRSPFLDEDVVDYVFQTRLDWRVIGKKRLFPHLPPGYQKAKNKIGFSSKMRQEFVNMTTSLEKREELVRVFKDSSLVNNLMKGDHLGHKYRIAVVARWIKTFL